jgi:ubiquinone/menaquinone biosynthesis C-methylase UbiE
VLQEALRVLKPGGKFLFIEHVAAPQGSRLRRVQNFLCPLWQLVVDGCNPNRETWTAINQAGFAHVQLEHFEVALPVVKPHMAGYGVKGS